MIWGLYFYVQLKIDIINKSGTYISMSLGFKLVVPQIALHETERTFYINKKYRSTLYLFSKESVAFLPRLDTSSV